MRKVAPISLKSLSPYQLGIFWAIASYEHTDGEYMLFRHRERYFLEQIQPLSGSGIQESHSRTGTQYRLKMSGFSLPDLEAWGWTARNAATRNIPPLDDFRGFLRAWIEIHSDLGYGPYPGDKSLQKIRFRIYGNYIMAESMSRLFNAYAGVGLKKPQPCVNQGKTCSIYYQGTAEIEMILKYIDGTPCFEKFWGNAYQKLKNPIITKCLTT